MVSQSQKAIFLQYILLSTSISFWVGEKKNVVHGMLTAFQIVHKKMPLTPTAALHLTQALQGGRMKREQIEGLQKSNQHLILKNYSIIKCIYQETDLQLTI